MPHMYSQIVLLHASTSMLLDYSLSVTDRVRNPKGVRSIT